ncbi:MAG: hypothetical protein OXD31_11100 [Chloroflexi bacterium]|nr:hypothetical protein [Chloroflexota bacterium]
MEATHPPRTVPPARRPADDQTPQVLDRRASPAALQVGLGEERNLPARTRT